MCQTRPSSPAQTGCCGPGLSTLRIGENLPRSQEPSPSIISPASFGSPSSSVSTFTLVFSSLLTGVALLALRGVAFFLAGVSSSSASALLRLRGVVAFFGFGFGVPFPPPAASPSSLTAPISLSRIGYHLSRACFGVLNPTSVATSVQST